MAERTIEKMCRDLLNLVPCKTPESSMDLAPMANELSKILERTQTSKSIEKRLAAQLCSHENMLMVAGGNAYECQQCGHEVTDLAQLRKDAERYRKLRDVVETDPYDALVVTAGGNVELGSMLYSGDRLDAAVDALT